MEVVLSFLSEFAENLLVAFAPALAGLIAAWLVQKIRVITADLKEKNDNFWIVDQVVTMAVQAAEQSGMSEAIENKKAFALDIVEKWLKERGIKIDIQLVDAAIEAAVLEEFI